MTMVTNRKERKEKIEKDVRLYALNSPYEAQQYNKQRYFLQIYSAKVCLSDLISINQTLLYLVY